MIIDRATVKTDWVRDDYEKLAKEQGRVDQEGFLQLMAAQLSNQDPMNPMSNEDMVAQMNQMSSLEELTKVNTNLMAMNQGQMIASGSAMIGKAVFGPDVSDGTQFSGIVDGLISEDGQVYVHVKGEEKVGLMAISQIQSLADPDAIVDDTTTTEAETESADETEATE